MNLTVKEKKLVTSLAKALLACLCLHTKDDFDAFRGTPYSWNIYHETCFSVWTLGLAKTAIGTSKDFVTYSDYLETAQATKNARNNSINGNYNFDFMSLENVDASIDFSLWGQHLNFRTLLEHFFYCLVKLGLNEKLPSSRTAIFEVFSPVLKISMIELANHGFAIVKAGKFQWTDKVAIHMISNYLWTQDEVIESRIDSALANRSTENLISQALDNIPIFSRGNISTTTPLGMSIALLEHWNGEKWSEDVLRNPEISFETAMETAKIFLSSYHPSGRVPDRAWALKQHKTLSGDEKRLVTALVKVIHTWWDTVPEDNDDPALRGYVFHDYASTFEHSADILWRLGLANAAWPRNNLLDISYENFKSYYANPQNLGFAPMFKPIQKDQIESSIRFGNFFPELSIYDMLCSFLELASDYGGTLCVDRHSRFSAPNQDYELALKALVEFGYAEQENSMYLWTDKIAAPMLENYFWTEDDFDAELVNSAFVNLTYSQMDRIGITKIPLEVQDGYLGRFTGNINGLAFCILRHWSNDGWTEEPLNTPSMSFDDAVAIAGAILEKHQHSEDHNAQCWVKLA